MGIGMPEKASGVMETPAMIPVAVGFGFPVVAVPEAPVLVPEGSEPLSVGVPVGFVEPVPEGVDSALESLFRPAMTPPTAPPTAPATTSTATTDIMIIRFLVNQLPPALPPAAVGLDADDGEMASLCSAIPPS